jgi:hypothetical protein
MTYSAILQISEHILQILICSGAIFEKKIMHSDSVLEQSGFSPAV